MEWKLLTAGRLTRNKFWGESDLLAYRPVVATSTLIRDGNTNILVDPSLPIGQMDALLRRRAGLSAEDIGLVYITHYHADHRVDALAYPHAACCISEGTLNDMRAAIAGGDPQAPDRPEAYQVVRGQLTNRIALVPLPGHTAGLTGLSFTSGGQQRVLVTGDAVMDQDFFRHAEGYWFDKAPLTSAETIRQAAGSADIVIPGHGDWFYAADCSPFGQTAPSWDCRRLFSGDMAQCAWLLRQEDCRLIVDPFVPASGMIRALFDHSGLYPVEIDAVVFAKETPALPPISALFSKARVYCVGDILPEGLTEEALAALLKRRDDPAFTRSA